jgi:hypothetical protein
MGVTSSLPLIVFLLFGYIISILYGDILKIFFKFQFFLKKYYLKNDKRNSMRNFIIRKA